MCVNVHTQSLGIEYLLYSKKEKTPSEISDPIVQSQNLHVYVVAYRVPYRSLSLMLRLQRKKRQKKLKIDRKEREQYPRLSLFPFQVFSYFNSIKLIYYEYYLKIIITLISFLNSPYIYIYIHTPHPTPHTPPPLFFICSSKLQQYRERDHQRDTHIHGVLMIQEQVLMQPHLVICQRKKRALLHLILFGLVLPFLCSFVF